jgi:hypothetical protein
LTVFLRSNRSHLDVMTRNLCRSFMLPGGRGEDISRQPRTLQGGMLHQLTSHFWYRIQLCQMCVNSWCTLFVTGSLPAAKKARLSVLVRHLQFHNSGIITHLDLWLLTQESFPRDQCNIANHTLIQWIPDIFGQDN